MDDDEKQQQQTADVQAADTGTVEAPVTQQRPSAKRPSARLSLAGKWAPSEGSHFDRRPYRFATTLANCLFPQSRQASKLYRQLCSSLRDELRIVERDMCRQQWADIHLSTVPARCHQLLKKAFRMHQPARYAAFLSQVKRGQASIKTGGLQPHELVSGYRSMLPPMETDDAAESQWKSAVEQLRGQLDEAEAVKALAIVDTSGSMAWNLQLGQWQRPGQLDSKMDSLAPIDAAMALALLIAQVNAPGPLQNAVITFSDEARWLELPSASTSTLGQRVDALRSGAANGGGTNVVNALTLLLDTAVERGWHDDDMPTAVFILTDMDFRTAQGHEQLHLGSLREQFGSRGLRLPRITLWNLAARAASSNSVKPWTDEAAKGKESGPAVLSCYSLPALAMALGQLDVDPMLAMLKAVGPYMAGVYVDSSEREPSEDSTGVEA